MSNFATNLKNVLAQSAKFIGKTANSAAKATKYKMDEMSALSKRRELIVDLGEKVYELAKQGTQLPEEACSLVEQLNTIETDLNGLRSEHADQKAAAAEQAAAEKAARAAEKAAAKSAAAIEKCTAPVDVEIPVPAANDILDVEEPTVCGDPVPTLDIEEAIKDNSNSDNNEIPTLNI